VLIWLCLYHCVSKSRAFNRRKEWKLTGSQVDSIVAKIIEEDNNGIKVKLRISTDYFDDGNFEIRSLSKILTDAEFIAFLKIRCEVKIASDAERELKG
jgi:hypothetical protein